MKRLTFILLLPLIIFYFGCSDNASNSTTSPIGGTGGNNGGGNGDGVTVQVQGQDNGNGYYIFSINPSVAINLVSVTASVASESYNQTIDINKQFSAGTSQPCLQYPSNVIQTGLKFVFQFNGTLQSNNQAFTVTTNYTTP